MLQTSTLRCVSWRSGTCEAMAFADSDRYTAAIDEGVATLDIAGVERAGAAHSHAAHVKIRAGASGGAGGKEDDHGKADEWGGKDADPADGIPDVGGRGAVTDPHAKPGAATMPAEAGAAMPSGYPGYHTFTFGGVEFTVRDRYRELQPIGRGAYGLVCSAVDTLAGRKVAIKSLPNMFRDLVDAKRILREVKLLGYLGDHVNVVSLIDVMTSPPETKRFRSLYIVTSLFDCDMSRIIYSKQVMTIEHVRYFMFQIMRGLKYIHSASVLHRDLKPPNLLVNANCDLAIGDFGLARGVDDDVATDGKLTAYVVTRWYRAPEILCNTAYNTASDVWSAGCIFAEMLGRRPLLQGASSIQQLQLIVKLLGTPSPSDLESVVDPAVRSAVEKMGIRAPMRLADLFPDASPVPLDLLAQMLVWNPKSRITVDDALCHPFLAPLHDRIADEVADKPFDFSFEKGQDLPAATIRRLVWNVMLSLQPKPRGASYDSKMADDDDAAAAMGCAGGGLSDEDDDDQVSRAEKSARRLASQESAVSVSARTPMAKRSRQLSE